MNPLITYFDNTLFNPDEALDEVQSCLGNKEEFDFVVGISKPFTLREHTLAVMKIFEEHFVAHFDSSILSRPEMRLLLALHDVGKPLAIREGDKTKQHIHTIELLNKWRGLLGLRQSAFNVMASMLSGDPLGTFLKGHMDRSAAAREIKQNAVNCRVEPLDFFIIFSVYYQCDVGAYTSIGKLIDVLNPLFEWSQDSLVFDESRNRLLFSPEYEMLYEKLQNLFE